MHSDLSIDLSTGLAKISSSTPLNQILKAFKMFQKVIISNRSETQCIG